jgi:hypothetical protein
MWSGVAVPRCGPEGHEGDARLTVDIRKPEFTSGYLFDVSAVVKRRCRARRQRIPTTQAGTALVLSLFRLCLLCVSNLVFSGWLWFGGGVAACLGRSLGSLKIGDSRFMGLIIGPALFIADRCIAHLTARFLRCDT